MFSVILNTNFATSAQELLTLNSTFTIQKLSLLVNPLQSSFSHLCILNYPLSHVEASILCRSLDIFLLWDSDFAILHTYLFSDFIFPCSTIKVFIITQAIPQRHVQAFVAFRTFF